MDAKKNDEERQERRERKMMLRAFGDGMEKYNFVHPAVRLKLMAEGKLHFNPFRPPSTSSEEDDCKSQDDHESAGMPEDASCHHIDAPSFDAKGAVTQEPLDFTASYVLKPTQEIPRAAGVSFP